MQSLTTNRKAYQQLAAQALGRDVRSPRIFTGQLREDAVPGGTSSLPLNPKQITATFTWGTAP
jgi:hypothetical protein